MVSRADASAKFDMIYVVDDEASVADMLVLGLGSYGYRVEAFTDPCTALEKFSTANPKPNVLITDFRMPGMDGLELIGRCQALCPALKTIGLSGMMTEEDWMRSGTRPDAVLVKPTPFSQMRDVIKRLVGTDESLR